MDPDEPPILAFDVFGTLTDCRGSIIRAGTLVDRCVDWSGLADAWIAEYGQTPVPFWVNLDAAFVGSFHRVAPRFGAERCHEVAYTWSRLEMWPDAREGLGSLRENGYALAAFSNGNREMLRSIGEANNFTWDRIYTAEDTRVRKPAEAMYRQLPKGAVVVAAHTFDLDAAHKFGLRTVLIARDGEVGSDPSGLRHAPYLVVRDCRELAARLRLD